MKKLAIILAFLPSIAFAEGPAKYVAAGVDLNELAKQEEAKKKEDAKKKEPAKKVEFSVSAAPNSVPSAPPPPAAPAFDPSTKITLTYGEIDAIVKGVTQSIMGRCSVSVVDAKIQAQLAEAASKAKEAAGEQKESTK